VEGEVAFMPTESQSVAAARDWYFDVLRRRRTAVKMLCLIALSIALFGAIAVSDGRGLGDIAPWLVEGALYGAGVIVLIWLLSYALLPYRVRRLYRQHRVRHGEYRWRWSGEGVGILSPNGEVRYAWSEIHRIVRGRSAFLLYFNDRHYLALPLEVLDARQARAFAAAAGTASRERP
jgi:YcxB-like protein